MNIYVREHKTVVIQSQLVCARSKDDLLLASIVKIAAKFWRFQYSCSTSGCLYIQKYILKRHREDVSPLHLVHKSLGELRPVTILFVRVRDYPRFAHQKWFHDTLKRVVIRYCYLILVKKLSRGKGVLTKLDTTTLCLFTSRFRSHNLLTKPLLFLFIPFYSHFAYHNQFCQ